MNILGQEVVSLNEICRSCLVKTDNMKNLLDPNEEVLQIITNLASVSNLEIEINESLPCYICNSCEEKLRSSYDFQQMVLKSHRFILACFSATDTLKASDILGIQNGSDSFANLIDSNSIETNAEVTYKNYIADTCAENVNNYDILIEGQNSEQAGNDKYWNTKEAENIYQEPVKLQQVDKKTKNNQTMRLAQYSSEQVDGIIKKIRGRIFRNVDCIYCGFRATHSRSLSVHMTRLHKQLKKKWCLYCNETFNNLEEHKLDHKDDFKCPFCGKYSTSTGHFTEHLASHSSERKYICHICQKCFISCRHLKLHCKVHADDQPNSLNLDEGHMGEVCKQSLDSEENVNNVDETGPIMDQKKAKLDNFCAECNKKVKNLIKHEEQYHLDSISKNDKDICKYLCSYCGKQLRSHARLTVHIRTHTGETPYKCSYCDKRTTTRFHLVLHERIHTGEKPHFCNVCGKSFSQSSILNTHMKLHTGRPEQCSICLKRFCRKSHLKEHMRRHTDEKPYLCTECGNGFNQRSHLVEHIKTHSSDRPFQCEFCEKGFKQASALKSHILIHLDKKPFKCSRCPYACRQRYSLRQHMLQHETDESKQSKIHSCEWCDLTFSTLALLSSHCTNDHGLLDETNVVTDDFEEKVKLHTEAGVANLIDM